MSIDGNTGGGSTGGGNTGGNSCNGSSGNTGGCTGGNTGGNSCNGSSGNGDSGSSDNSNDDYVEMGEARQRFRVPPAAIISTTLLALGAIVATAYHLGSNNKYAQSHDGEANPDGFRDKMIAVGFGGTALLSLLGNLCCYCNSRATPYRPVSEATISRGDNVPFALPVSVRDEDYSADSKDAAEKMV